jgi:NitT/TauT family transport system substrate-binding protein
MVARIEPVLLFFRFDLKLVEGDCRMLNKYAFRWLGLLILIPLALVACSPGNTPQATVSPVQQQPTQAVEPVALKVVLIPVLDTLPIRVANEEGLFEKYGVKVELVPAQAAPERDQLISAGQADGMINEVLSTMFYNQNETQVEIVRYARSATSQDSLFAIVVSGNSGIETLDDLRGVEIGISEGTVIEYVTSRLLEAEGFSDEDIKVVAVPNISSRFVLVVNGELKAAVLPEPLTSLAVSQGARVILSDTRHPEYSFSTLTFRKEVIDQHPEAIRGFLAAVEEAVTLLNNDPDQYKHILADHQLVPAPLLETFKMPVFGTAGVPTQAQWDDTLTWAKAKGLISKDLAYSDSVNASFLP